METPSSPDLQVEAPGNGDSVGLVEPAINQITKPQGTLEDYTPDASPLRIERMLRTVFTNEEKVGLWEKLAPVLNGKSYVKVPGEDRPRYVTADKELVKAQSERDNHIDEMRHVIDYALTTDAYEDIPCSVCEPWHLPEAPLDFIRAVAEAEKPPAITALCQTCQGRGVVRRLKADTEAKAAFKRISYFNKVLDTTIRCAKIRYNTADQDEAYRELEQKHARLLIKFRSEFQTCMEQDDAEQGARMGIVDAAKRFDPTRTTNADFGTVAYSWGYRNSRARHKSDERAGVYAPSVDSWATDEDGRKATDRLRSIDGAVASFQSSAADPMLARDMRKQIAKLPTKQRKVVTAILNGDNLRDTAERLKINAYKARQLREEAFSTLRESMADYVDVIHD